MIDLTALTAWLELDGPNLGLDLTRGNPRTALPSCWSRHAPVAWEIEGLRRAWGGIREAITSPDPSYVVAPRDWLDLTNASSQPVLRIHNHLAACKTGNCPYT